MIDLVLLLGLLVLVALPKTCSAAAYLLQARYPRRVIRTRRGDMYSLVLGVFIVVLILRVICGA